MSSTDQTTFPRHWRTAAGSTVTEPRWGVWEMDWDWFEEHCCCSGCHLGFDSDGAEGVITWRCDGCDNEGSVIAQPVKEAANVE
jgi:hypothetical protein